MKSITATATAFALLVGSACAAPADIAGRGLSPRALSKAFNLVLESKNATYNDMPLATCHVGAGAEAICVPPSGTSVAPGFYFNKTTDVPVKNAGYLIFEIPDDQVGETTFPMYLRSPASGSNIAFAVFMADVSNEQLIAFGKDHKMGIVNDGTLRTGKWHVCEYDFEDSYYNTLVWKYGDEAATTPGCAAVTVHRKAM